MVYAFTDYPLVALGDIAGQKAPIRRVEPLSFDGNKYVRVRFEGRVFEFKSGYLYTKPGRLGEVPTFDSKTLSTTVRDQFPR